MRTEKLFSLITTTIHIPVLLEAYVKDALRFGRNIEQVIVVGDRKTPFGTETFCKNLQKKLGVRCIYLGVSDQKKYLKKWPTFQKFLPWNSIQRRNVGLLYAYFQGTADVLVTIDDDNFIHDKDYLGSHFHVGDIQKLTVVHSPTGWWNVCEMLDESREIPFYHRGFPLSKRWLLNEQKRHLLSRQGRVIVNAGLWFGDPDVDALTRLYFPADVVKKSKFFQKRIACDLKTWSPFNSQNTAIARDIIPAYFLFPYIGRYDDIWASYVVRHLADFFGDFVTYGSPMVRQKRNPHNYFADFDQERFGLVYNDIFIKILLQCRLGGTKTYREAFAHVALQFERLAKSLCKKEGVALNSFDAVIKGFHLWSDIFRNI